MKYVIRCHELGAECDFVATGETLIKVKRAALPAMTRTAPRPVPLEGAGRRAKPHPDNTLHPSRAPENPIPYH